MIMEISLKLLIIGFLILLNGCAIDRSKLGPMTYTTSGLVHTLSCQYPYRRTVCKREAYRICKKVEDHRKTVIVGTGHSVNDDRKIREGTWAVVVFACEK